MPVATGFIDSFQFSECCIAISQPPECLSVGEPTARSTYFSFRCDEYARDYYLFSIIYENTACLFFVYTRICAARTPRDRETRSVQADVDQRVTLPRIARRHYNGASFSREVSMPTTTSGLIIEELVLGEGAAVAAGQSVTVHYTGWLTSGKKFDSSKDRDDPFVFPLGAGHVIRGWDEGVQGMKVGGSRKLTIPPELGYGARGAGGVIPPNATLVFEVELLGIG